MRPIGPKGRWPATRLFRTSGVLAGLLLTPVLVAGCPRGEVWVGPTRLSARWAGQCLEEGSIANRIPGLPPRREVGKDDRDDVAQVACNDGGTRPGDSRLTAVDSHREASRCEERQIARRVAQRHQTAGRMAGESAPISSESRLVGWQANLQKLSGQDSAHLAHLAAASPVKAESIGDDPDGESPGYRCQHYLQARLVEAFDSGPDAIEPVGIAENILDVAEPDAAQSTSRSRRKDVVPDLTGVVFTL